MAPARNDLKSLLAYLRDTRGFDFSGYKVPSLERRLRRRLEALQIDNYEDYRDYLEVQPGEFEALFNTILINVTSFFRDPEAWDCIAEKVVPEILEARADDEPIRVWSAGCASGEEAYSIAMLLGEALGPEEFLRRVKIYGTDVDEDALETARVGLYEDAALEAVPERLREDFVERQGEQWCFRRDLRRAVIFGRNNLVEDAPISRLDLLLCRNTVMYFTSETQNQILRRLHFALRPTGYLFLGKSEMLLTRRELFEPVDLKRRVFKKVAGSGDRARPPLLVPSELDLVENGGPANAAALTLDATPGAHLVVGADRTLLLASEGARRLLRVRGPDVGRPLQDLEVSYRPAELRQGIDTAFAERRPVSLGPVVHRHDGQELCFEIVITPLPDHEGADAVSVVFTDVTAQRVAEQELERARQELGSAYEELQSTVEELETTNEELQSTNEELETTNEELQSTNEELETMNEELQSTNEELETMNDELRQRTLDLREVNAVMETILRAKGVGIIVVDREQHVRVWSRQSEELWGLRADEVMGVPVFGLDIGLPLDAVRPALKKALTDDSEPETIEVGATDRRGRSFRCRVTSLPLVVDGGEVTAAIVLAERAED